MKKNKIKIHINIWITLGIAFLFIGGCTAFFAGSFSNSARIENIAEYGTYVVKNHTKKGRYCSISVEKTSDSGDLLNPIAEFHTLYGAFRQTKATFASMINLYDDYSIYFDEISTENSLPLFYLGMGTSVSYNGHYKHMTFPFELMFTACPVRSYNAYISQSQADKLLEKRFLKKDSYSASEYKTLIGSEVLISVDGTKYNFNIADIYYETNYYYECIREIAGEFILCSYEALPCNLLQQRRNLYFLSEYTYQNQFFMNHISETYNNHKFGLRVNHKNVVGDIDDSRILSFYNLNIKNEEHIFATVMLVMIGVISYLGAFILFLKESKKMTLFNHVISLLSLLIPYCLFALIFKFSNNLFLFSGFSTKLVLWANIIFFILYFLFVIKKINQRFFNKLDRREHHEIDI